MHDFPQGMFSIHIHTTVILPEASSAGCVRMQGYVHSRVMVWLIELGEMLQCIVVTMQMQAIAMMSAAGHHA